MPLVLEGQCGTQAHFYLMVILVASYPLKPHGRSTSFQGVPLVVKVKVPRLFPLGIGIFSLFLSWWWWLVAIWL